MIDTEKAEYERVIGELVAKVQELVAANERLTSELTAHQTLRAIYSDSTQPATCTSSRGPGGAQRRNAFAKAARAGDRRDC